MKERENGVYESTQDTGSHNFNEPSLSGQSTTDPDWVDLNEQQAYENYFISWYEWTFFILAPYTISKPNQRIGEWQSIERVEI